MARAPPNNPMFLPKPPTKAAFFMSKINNNLINRRRPPGPEELCEVYEADVPDEAAIGEDEDILNYDDLDDPNAFV